MNYRFGGRGVRAALLSCTAGAALLAASTAWAQGGSAGGGSPAGAPTEQPSPPDISAGAVGSVGGQAGAAGTSSSTSAPSATAAPSRSEQGTTLQEIVVTAQKRAQNLQDVPISVTAVTAATLQAQRIANVDDLSGATPNFTARLSGGGAGIPSFSMRGIESEGVVPGSDKEISIYVDGVYIGTSTGSVFDLPDIERIEVLHGPQGTLFGRNATAGAVSIITPDAPGRFGLHAEGSIGNYDERRVKLRLDTPSFAGFSGSISYVHDQSNGDIKNTGAGTTWYRNSPVATEQPSVQTSPKYLGSKDEDEVFASVRYHPFSALNITYKFDYSQNHFTPQGNALTGTNFPFLGPAGGGLATLILATQGAPYPIDTSGKRPNSVNNSFTTPGYANDFGHNLTMTYRINDSLSFKNIAAYRSNFLYSNSQLDGAGGLSVTPTTAALAPALAPLQGALFTLFADSTETNENQWSDEPQVNYDSKYLTLTVGALFFHENTQNGSPPGIPNNYAFTFFGSGVLPQLLGPPGTVGVGRSLSYNTETSTAGYIQAEVHVLPNVDIVGGYRTTDDHKTGEYLSTGPDLDFVYDKTKPSYLLGINYKPERDLLLYAKYSTAFVSGGAVGPIGFLPETAQSYEGGFKGDFLRHRLQADLSVFSVRYANIQAANSGQNVGQPLIGTVVVDQGGEKARGFEFQGSAIPIRNLTFGLGAGYTDYHLTSVNPLLTGDGALGPFYPALEPKWTTNLSAQYETDPLFGSARVLFRSDASWHSRTRSDNYSDFDTIFPATASIPAVWNLSARIALEHIDLPYGTGQVALWGKNLTDDRSIAFPENFFFIASSTFVQARTYGVDLIYDF